MRIRWAKFVIVACIAVGLVLPGAAWAQWTIETVDSPGDVGRYASNALDANLNPHFSYMDYVSSSDGSLKYATTDGTSWTRETVDSDNTAYYTGAYSSIALDSADNPHIAYHDVFTRVRYATRNGGGWSTETAYGPSTAFGNGYGGFYTSLALKSNDDPAIAFYISDYQRPGYTTNDGSGWDWEIPRNAIGHGWDMSLALDSNDYPRLAYHDNNSDDLEYSRWDGTQWWHSAVDFAGNVGTYTSLALDANDFGHISYYDVTNQALKYAYQPLGGSWSVQTVDTGLVGQHTSLALDGNGNPWISYYDQGNEALKLAMWDGAAWDISTVDAGGDVGRYSSIAYRESSAGWAVDIAYYDMTNGDLKHAYQQTPEPATIVLLGCSALVGGIIRRKRET